MSERGKFVSLHGIDGTGKSTVARSIATLLEAEGKPVINYDEFKDTIPNPHAAEKARADAEGSLEERVAAHLTSTMYHSDRIRDLTNQGYHVVKSRYLDDVMAHFSHLGVPAERLRELSSAFPAVQPELKVILTTIETERRRRINARPVIDEQDKEEKIDGSRALYFEDYLRNAAREAPGKFLLLDNTGIDADEVARQIIDRLMQTP